MSSDTVSNRKAAAILAVMAVVTGTVAYFSLRPAQPQALPPLTLKDPPTAMRSSGTGSNGSRTSAADSTVTDEDAPAAAGGIKVHVTGAVMRQGVYALPAGARVQDAIAAAGGVLPQGDANALNQAEILEDGGKVVVPAAGSAPVPTQRVSERSGAANQANWPNPDTGHIIVRQAPGTSPQISQNGWPAQPTPPPAQAPVLAAGPQQVTVQQSGGSGSSSVVINLNTASQAQLMQVGRIGAVTADKIISYREEHGGFRSVEELRNIRGIGAKTYERIAPFFTVN